MKTIIMGPAGKMGRAMVAQADKRHNMELVGAVGPKGRDYIGQDIGVVCHLGKRLNIPVHDRLNAIIHQCDLVLDCTLPHVSMQALACCVTHRKAFVCGTTGFRDDQMKAFETAAKSIAVLMATNTSKMFNLLFELVKKVASQMGGNVDIDIIDMHDNKKLDAPSGTSKQIAEIISETLDYDRDDYTYGRNGMGTRKPGSIAFSSIRSGGLPGAIKVIFGYENERMELSAHVYNMGTYASGMIEAGIFLKNKKSGLYSLKDAFNL